MISTPGLTHEWVAGEEKKKKKKEQAPEERKKEKERKLELKMFFLTCGDNELKRQQKKAEQKHKAKLEKQHQQKKAEQASFAGVVLFRRSHSCSRPLAVAHTRT